VTDKLIPTEDDRLAQGFEDATGIPSLNTGAPGAGAPHKPESKVSAQVVLAGAVLVLAAGAIYGMRFVGLNAGGGRDNVKIDYTSQSGAPEMVRRFERVMTELDASMSAVQLAAGEPLPESPFSRPQQESDQPVAIEQPSTLDDLDRLARLAAEQERLKREERAALLEAELARLQVQGVMAGGRMPVARINGQAVTVGKTLGAFEVVEISGQSVFLTADERVWELRLGTPAREIE
jgi:hypothetical protein